MTQLSPKPLPSPWRAVALAAALALGGAAVAHGPPPPALMVVRRAAPHAVSTAAALRPAHLHMSPRRGPESPPRAMLHEAIGRFPLLDGRPRWRARSALAALVGLAGLAGLAAAGAGRLARRWCRGTALGTALSPQPWRVVTTGALRSNLPPIGVACPRSISARCSAANPVVVAICGDEGLVAREEFQQLQAALELRDQQRDGTLKHSIKLNQLANRTLFHIHRGEMEEVERLQAEFQARAQQAIEPVADIAEVRWLLDGCLETYVAGVVFVHFLRSARVPVKQDIPLPVTSNEYLAGVCGFLRELQRYAAAQAVRRDVPSVLLCRDVIEAVQAQLMLFDFRNSPLRRKYDGIKYAVKAVEDILYDLSLTTFEEAVPLQAGQCPARPPEALLAPEHFEQLRKEMEEYDATRDTIIKRSRDITKNAKNAIYSLHRGDATRADQQLRDSEAVARELLPLVQDRTLRFNSYADGLEEYAEAAAFRHFMQKGTIIRQADLPLLEVSEYLGALVDLTGEIGRYAVAQATRRDMAAVERCRAALDAVSGEMLLLRLPGSVHKKGDSLSVNLRKVERLQYDLMLATGGKRPPPPDAPSAAPKAEDEEA